MQGFFALGASAYVPPRKRRHTSQACDPCSRRKVRCDSSRPTCSACAWRGDPAGCLYTTVHQRRGPKPSQAKRQAKQQEKAASDTPEVTITSVFSSATATTAKFLLEKSNKRRKTIVVNAPSSPCPSSPTSTIPMELSLVKEEGDGLAIDRPVELNPDLEHQLLVAFLDIYYLSSPVRIIHRPTVKKNLAGISPVLASAMCAIAARFGTLIEPYATTVSSYYYARTRTFTIQQLDEPTLDTVSAAILLVMYASAVHDTSKGWNYAGMAVRMAQYMRLNIDPDDLVPATNMSWHEKERYRRVWWGICVLDRCVACFTTGPKIVDEKEVTTRMPECEELWEGPEDPSMLGIPDSDFATQGNPFVATVGLIRLFLEARVHNTKTHHDRVELAKIDAALGEWITALPERFRPLLSQDDHFSVLLPSVDYGSLATILLCHSACVLTLHRTHMLEELAPNNLGGPCTSTNICIRTADKSTAIIRWFWRISFSPLWNIFSVFCIYQTGRVQVELFRHLRDSSSRFRCLRGAEVHVSFLEASAPHLQLACILAEDLRAAMATAEQECAEEEKRLIQSRAADVCFDLRDLRALLQVFSV